MDTVNTHPRKAGPKSHKPNCQCFACKGTRKRAAQALASPTGASEAPQEAVIVARAPLPVGTDNRYPARDTRLPQDAISAPDQAPGSQEPSESLLEPASPPEAPLTITPQQKRWDSHKAREWEARQAVLNANLPTLVAPLGRSNRDRVTQWMAMRTAEPSITNAECARRMGLQPNSLSSILSKAVKEGWLKFEDPLERIEHEIIPMTLDNISEMLAQKNEKITIETAKATVYPQFRESKGISHTPQTVLAIKIEQAPANPDGQVIVVTDQIVGKPLTFADDKES